MKKFIVFVSLGVALISAAQAQCNLYPIALSAQTLANAQPGTLLPDIYNGTQPGNFGWLTWAGSPSEPTLVNSLTGPGDSDTYVNPANSADHQVNIGDWVQGKPGVSNSKGVRDALDSFENMVITVPVWDVSTGSGNNSAYRVIGFANVQIVDYRLPGQNKISAVFYGFTDCEPHD